MQDDVVFYTQPMSRGRTVRWMLEEIGRPYRTELVQYGSAMKTPEFLALNPMGKVPVLTHGDAIVTETAAICAYLADAFAEARLAPPPTDRRRGPYYRWLFFAAGPIEAAVTDKALGIDVPSERKRMVGYGSYPDVLAALERALEQRDYLVGEEFTAADLVLGSQLGFGLRFGTIEHRPAFVRYWERIGDRPAAVRAREIDDALLAEQAKSGEAAAQR